MFIKDETNRGFSILSFLDEYDVLCNIQKSSLASNDCIWLGVEDADPKIMASQTPQGGTGWVKYNIPKEVLLSTRMHLNRKQARELAKLLNKFARTGELI
jgi:hypothetical protein